MEAGGIGDETGDGFFATAAGSGGWQVVCGAVVGFVGSIGGGEVVLGGWFVVEGVGWCRHDLGVGGEAEGRGEVSLGHNFNLNFWFKIQ